MSNTIEVTTEGDTIITVTPEGDVTVGVEYNPVAGSGSDTNIGITRTNSAVTVTSSSGSDGTILAADSLNAGVFTSANYTKLAGIEAGADVTDLTNVGAALTTATAKGTIVDADLVNIQDSAASFAPKTTLWSLVKSTLKTYFDTLYPSGSGTVTGTNTGDQSIFKNIAVAGQSTVVADTTNDTLTLVAGTNITLTTDAVTDTVTITASGGDGNVVGPASATDGAFALFDTTTGKLLKNGSVPGGAATLNVGTSAGTVAAGDDSRFTNAVVGPASSTDNAFARFDSTTGKLLQNSTATLDDVGLAALDGVQFSTTPTSTVGQAKAVWDATDSCLSIGLNASVNALVGTDSHVQVYNDSASTMTVMQVVRQSGSSGTRLKVALALANTDATSATTIGVVAQSIASNSQGFIQTAGLLQRVNTNAFDEGDTLWLSATTAGLITNVKPTAPNHGVRIGYCIKKAGAGAGIILIDILNGFELDELHDVKITTPIADNSFLVYNTTSSVWENKSDVPAAQLTGTIDLARLPAITLAKMASGTAGNLISYDASGNPVAVATGTAGQVLTSNGAGAAPTMQTASGLPITGGTLTGNLNIGPFTGAVLAVLEGAVEGILRPNNLEFYNSDDGFGTTLQPGAIFGAVTITLPSATGTLQTTNTLPTVIQLACSDETTALTVGTAKVTFRMPFAMTLTGVGVRASVTTAPTGSTLIVDIKENGTTILGALATQKLSIDATEKTSTTAANPVVISDSALANDAEITIDITQIGSTIAGAGLKVTFIGILA